MRKKRGSAILIVMLLVTVLATVALSVGYLTLAEVTIETNSEDGVMAYYAAEAGIEDGLEMFRNNRNVELGFYADSSSTNVGCTGSISSSKLDCAKRVDLTDNSNSAPLVDMAGLPVNPTSQYYDLRIWYKEDGASSYGTADMVYDANDKTVPFLGKDESLFLEGFEGNYTIHLKFVPENTDGCDMAKPAALDNPCFVQIKGGNIDPLFVTHTEGLSGVTIDVQAGKTLQIKSWGKNIQYQIKAIGADGQPVKIDSGFTYIESIGYYGSVKRKLQAKVNRKTGKLLEIFDFTLFSGNGSIQTN